MIRKTPSLLVVLFFLGQCVFSADQRVAITGRYVTQPSAPVQITSLTEASQDLLSAVTVANKTTKTVTSFRLGWAVGIPQACSAGATVPQITRAMAPADRVTLNPNESATMKSYGLTPQDLIANSKRENAALITFQVAVMEVTFSDGSTWNAGFSEDGMLDGSAFDLEGERCSGGSLLPQKSCSPGSTASPASEAASRSNVDGRLLAASSLGISNGPTPSILPVCHFTCGGTSAGTFCQNNDTSCTIEGCSNPLVCANSMCQLIACGSD